MVIGNTYSKLLRSMSGRTQPGRNVLVEKGRATGAVPTSGVRWCCVVGRPPSCTITVQYRLRGASYLWFSGLSPAMIGPTCVASVGHRPLPVRCRAVASRRVTCDESRRIARLAQYSNTVISNAGVASFASFPLFALRHGTYTRPSRGGCGSPFSAVEDGAA
jgi:hypothetical protein